MSLSAVGVLSFDQFGLGLSERVTFVVGPNGAGKSNLTRLLTICQRAVESGDGAAGDVDRLLASFLAARHVGSQSPGVEARIAVRLTDMVERELVTEFVRAIVTGAMTSRRQVQNMAEIDAWAEAEITEDKLQPLMEGEISCRTASSWPRPGAGRVHPRAMRPRPAGPAWHPCCTQYCKRGRAAVWCRRQRQGR